MKKFLALLLALVMVLSLIPTLAFAAGEDYSKVTVYFSLSDNGKYKNGTSGKTLAYVPVTVEYFDLDDYGLGKYTRADAGEQPTVLHLFIKMLEQEYLNSGKLTVGGDALTVSGGAGSMYMTQFWGHDQNLTYYVNHVYPIMSGSTGATADWIILKDGDVVDVAMFDDWSFWGDAYAGFQYFMDGDAPTHSYTATAGEAKTITCKTAQTNMMSPSGTQYNVCGTQTVYYGKTLFASDAQSVTTDSSGAASITFPEAGDWYVWANGAKGKSTNNVVSSPAYAAVTVEAGGVTTPKLTLTTDKESVIWNEKVTVTATNEKGEPVWPDAPAGDTQAVQDDSQENTAFARYMSDAMFLIPTPQVLQKIITGLDDLYEHDLSEQDMQGDLYEYMLGKLATAGQNGQFRTPKHIREMMVELLKPTPDDTICDPACGTAGFLVSSSEYIRKNYEDTMTTEQWEHFAGPAFTGFDTDRTMLRISAMNLMLHSISNPDVDYKDSVSKQNEISEKFTMILANPPFKGTVDAESIHDNLKAVTNTKKTELLFLALFLRMLKKGGQCTCIVPDGVLFGSSKAHKAIRQELVENHQLRAVISMPSGVFKPYAGVSTAVLVFTKTGAGGTDKVWFYDMKADGFSLDDKRSEISENDIPDIITRFHNLEAETGRERTEQSFFVPKQEIVDNGYDLSINKYKKVEYVPVEYLSTQEILTNLRELEMQIGQEMDELEKLLGL